MSITIGRIAPAGASQPPEGRQANFGSLVSAIRRGDLDEAGNAFAALQELAPDVPGWKHKGALTKIGEAIESQDIEAVRAALKEFQQGRRYQLEPEVEREKSAQGGLLPGGSISILA